MDLCVRVPEYELDGFLFLKDHYEGAYLYRDTVFLEATPPADTQGNWLFEYSFANDRASGKRPAQIIEDTEDTLTFEIPISQPHPPGIAARLRVKTQYWNTWQKS
jgi:hypothetical protein